MKTNIIKRNLIVALFFALVVLLALVASLALKVILEWMGFNSYLAFGVTVFLATYLTGIVGFSGESIKSYIKTGKLK